MIQEFTLPSIDLGRVDGHAIALISTQVCNASSYYQDAYEGGSAFLLLFDRRIDDQPSFDRTRLFRSFFDLVTRYELNHRNTLLAYFRMKGLAPVDTDYSITCELETGELINAGFDDTGRLISANGETIET